MKQKIHPTYYLKATITCACGNILVTGSTMKENDVEVCSSCHPFFTGKSKMIDTQGRVDRFKRLLEKKEEKSEKAKKSKKKKLKKNKK